MNYQFAHPTSIQVTILDKKTKKKIGDIQIKPSTVLWKSGNRGAYKQNYVSTDEFIEWMKSKPAR